MNPGLKEPGFVFGRGNNIMNKKEIDSIVYLIKEAKRKGTPKPIVFISHWLVTSYLAVVRPFRPTTQGSVLLKIHLFKI